MPGVETTMLLCDYAEALNGKLYVMGAGWNILYAVDEPVTTAVAALVEVPWDETNRRHAFTVELVTGDGESVEVEGHVVVANGEFEVGRPPGVKPGMSFNTPFVWTFNGLVLPAGTYEWRMTVNEELAARRAFAVTERPHSVQLP
jgi:hypothetical protein